MGWRAASRSNSFLIISVWMVTGNKKCCYYVTLAGVSKTVSNIWWVYHLEGREIRGGQVAQVVFGRSVSSGLLLNQCCSLEGKAELNTSYYINFFHVTLNIWYLSNSGVQATTTHTNRFVLNQLPHTNDWRIFSMSEIHERFKPVKYVINSSIIIPHKIYTDEIIWIN